MLPLAEFSVEGSQLDESNSLITSDRIRLDAVSALTAGCDTNMLSLVRSAVVLLAILLVDESLPSVPGQRCMYGDRTKPDFIHRRPVANTHQISNFF